MQGSFALFPFILVGLWQLRGKKEVQYAGWMWLVIFAALTVVFPFAGINGSFFHSGAAVQLVFWSAAPVGIETAVGFISRLRKWEKGRQVQRFVEVLLVFTVFLLSGGLLYQHVAGTVEAGPWSGSGLHYQRVENALVKLGATTEDRVMVKGLKGAVTLGDDSEVLASQTR